MMKYKSRWTALAAPILASPLLLASPISYSEANAFVHLFEWGWQDVASECENFLGANGYSAVQVSPPQEHITGDTWWTRYQPVSYQLISRGGNRTEFIDMVNRCKAVGVDIYVDAVINHMANGAGTGTAGSDYGEYQYPAYSPWDFHNPCDVINYNDRWQVQNCELVGLPDLNTDANYVQNNIAAYLQDLINLGVAGFRIDAAKHMPAADITNLLSKINGMPLIFQEVIDQGGEAVTSVEYIGNGLVTEFKYSTELGRVFREGNLAWLETFGEAWGFLPGDSAVVFVDNHDNQRGHGGGGNVITHEDGRLYELANVFMLAHPYGYPKVMSSYDFHGDTDAGPPPGAINCYENARLCEHRWDYIAGAIAFRKSTAGNAAMTNWWTNGSNQIAFGRGELGFVAINKEDSNLSTSLNSQMAPGDYCNLLDGGTNANNTSCEGSVITVLPDQSVALNMAPWTAVAISHESKLATDSNPSDWQRTVIFIQAQTNSGQDMFIRGGIDHNYAQSQLGVTCTEANKLCAIPIEHNNLINPTTAGWKNGDTLLDWYGPQANQTSEAEGTPLDWTTDIWPVEWGQERTVATDGFGVEPLNHWGQHYWMLDVQMDCSKTVDGWFELKAYVKNGEGWENDIQQANAPYPSNNHFAQCGKVNRFEFGNNQYEQFNF
jgi:alpha-amylase